MIGVRSLGGSAEYVESLAYCAALLDLHRVDPFVGGRLDVGHDADRAGWLTTCAGSPFAGLSGLGECWLFTAHLLAILITRLRSDSLMDARSWSLIRLAGVRFQRCS